MPLESFNELLKWHLTRGTRPNGSPEVTGRQWSPKEFAAAVGVDDRTVRNWLNGQNSPVELASVERELFGENPAFGQWRQGLREAHQRARNPEPAAADSPNPTADSETDAEKAPVSSKLIRNAVGEARRLKALLSTETVALVVLGAAADICTVSGAQIALKLSLAVLILFIFLGITARVRDWLCNYCLGTCIAALVAAIIFGSITYLQRLTDSDNKGFFAENFSSIGKLQQDLLDGQRIQTVDLGQLVKGQNWLIRSQKRSETSLAKIETDTGRIPDIADDVRKLLKQTPPIQGGDTNQPVSIPSYMLPFEFSTLPQGSIQLPTVFGQVRVPTQADFLEGPKKSDPRLDRAARLEQQGKIVAAIALRQAVAVENERSAEANERAANLNKRNAAIARRNLAAVAAAQARIDDAIKHYSRAIDLDPIASDFIGLGNAFFDRGMYSAAFFNFEEAIRRDQPLAAAFNGRANVHRENKNYPAADSDYENAIRLDPNFAPSYNGIGNIHFDQRQYDMAITFYTKAIKLDTRLAVAYGNRGNAYFELSDYDHAIMDCTDAIKLNRTLAYAHTCLGHSYWKKKDSDRALAEYDEALRWDPKNVAALNGRGNIHLERKEYGAAIVEYETAHNLDPKYAHPLNGLGSVSYANKNYAEAITHFSDAIILDPKYAVAYSNRAAAKIASDVGGAAPDYDTVIRLDPKSESAHVGRGKLYLKDDEWDKALLEFDQVIKVTEGNSEAYYYRGACRLIKGDNDGAIRDLDKAIELDQTFAPAFASRGWAYAAKHEFAQAFADFGQALRLDPKSEQGLGQRAFAHISATEYKAAIADFDEFVRLHPNEALGYFGRGLALLLGREDAGRAAADFEKVASLDPKTPAGFVGQAMLSVVQKRYDEAIANLTQAMALDIKTPIFTSNMLISRSGAYLLNGNADLAMQDLDSAIRIAPSALAYLYRGNQFFTGRDYEKAIGDYKRSVELAPGDAVAQRNLGHAYFNRRLYDEALKAYEAANSIAPDATTFFYVGQIYLLNKSDSQTAISNYTNAISADPDQPNFYAARASALLMEGHTQEAFKDYNKLISLDHDDAAAFNARGSGYAFVHDYASAIADFTEAIRLHDDWADSFFHRGDALYKMGDFARAASDFSKAIDIEGNDALLLYNRALANSAREQFLFAISDLSQVVRSEPENGQALFDRGEAYFSIQNYPQAIQDYEKALTVSPKNPDVMLMLFLARTRMSVSTASSQLMASSAQVNPTHSEYAIIELFLGKRTAEAALAEAGDDIGRCRTTFFVGEWYALQNESAAATQSLDTSATICPKQLQARINVELKLLNSLWYRLWAKFLRTLYSVGSLAAAT